MFSVRIPVPIRFPRRNCGRREVDPRAPDAGTPRKRTRLRDAWTLARAGASGARAGLGAPVPIRRPPARSARDR